MTNNIVTLIINTSIYDTLLTRDKQLQLAPSLATSHKAREREGVGGQAPQGVKFHNGEPFDANAVKFSFERNLRTDFKSPQKGWFSTIERVEIVDPYTVRFHTKVPDPAMPARMTLMYQLAPKYVAQVGDVQCQSQAVGTGPFKFVEWTKNDRIVVEANDAHWSGKPAVRRATWRPIPELGARIAALQTGQADLIVNVPPDQLQTLAATKSVRVEKIPSCRIIYFGIAQIKAGRSPIRRVRQAINHAVDVRASSTACSRQWQADQLVHAPQCVGLRSVHSALRLQPQETKELWRRGQTNLSSRSGPNGRWAMDKDIAQAVAGQLTENASRPTSRSSASGELRPLGAGPQDRDIFMNGWCLPSLEPDHWVTPNLHTGEPVSQYSNPEVDKLMEQAARDEYGEAEAALQPAALLIRDDGHGSSATSRWTSTASAIASSGRRGVMSRYG
jgi:peptide/nickel transport system substrate-binding protein